MVNRLIEGTTTSCGSPKPLYVVVGGGMREKGRELKSRLNGSLKWDLKGTEG